MGAFYGITGKGPIAADFQLMSANQEQLGRELREQTRIQRNHRGDAEARRGTGAARRHLPQMNADEVQMVQLTCLEKPIGRCVF
jgi:hypothetical protein